MLRLRALVVCAVAVWSWPAAAFACKCAAPAAVADALLAADAVFEGQVAKLTPVGDHDLVVELNLVRTFKGANTERIRVRTPAESAACGYPFALGESYLVYADPVEASAELPTLAVHHCGRTKLMTEAEADLGTLGMGVVPVSPTADDLPPGIAPTPSGKPAGAIEKQRDKPAAGGCASCSAGTGTANPDAGFCIGLLLAAAGIARATRRRAR